MFNVNYMVYFDNSPAPKRRQQMTSTVEDPSFKLRPMKSGLHRVVLATPHTETINIDGLHNIVAIDRVTLSQAAQEINRDASERNCENQFSPNHGIILGKPLIVEAVLEKNVYTAPKDDGLSQKTQEDTVRPELQEQRTPTSKEKQKQSTEYFVDRVVDGKADV